MGLGVFLLGISSGSDWLAPMRAVWRKVNLIFTYYVKNRIMLEE